VSPQTGHARKLQFGFGVVARFPPNIEPAVISFFTTLLAPRHHRQTGSKIDNAYSYTQTEIITRAGYFAKLSNQSIFICSANISYIKALAPGVRYMGQMIFA
jgi:hypothetical protein